MAMASILTGYVELFSEMGLGSAIIQKKEITQEELSSTFWFNIGVGVIFAILCFGLAYPTAWIFDEYRIVPITEMISFLFIIGSLMIVPYTVLAREARFKEIGIINLVAVIISSLSMLFMASRGFGVWTLIYGTIILRLITVMLTFLLSKWRPLLHFRLDEVKGLLKFGLHIAGSRSLSYVLQKSDKFIAGKFFNAQSLGYYSFAVQLASIPTDKIVSTVQQVSFTVFSKYQGELEKCQDMYLKSVRYIGIFSIPLFTGGFFLGDEIIRVLLGDKWAPIIFMFRFLCLAQVVQAITAINGTINSSLGRPHWYLYFVVINLLVMPISILAAAMYGLNALVIPWITLYPLICVGWTWITLRKLNINIMDYLNIFIKPLCGTGLMVAGIIFIQLLHSNNLIHAENLRGMFILEISIGAAIYTLWTLFAEKKALLDLASLIKS